MKNIFAKIFLTSILVVLLAPSLALAFAPIDPAATDSMKLYANDIIKDNFNPTTDENSVTVIVSQVIKVFLGLLATIFIILFIISGYNWMTSNGEEKKVKAAQETIKAAIIGLIIVVAAYIVTYFVFLALPEGV